MKYQVLYTIETEIEAISEKEACFAILKSTTFSVEHPDARVGRITVDVTKSDAKTSQN